MKRTRMHAPQRAQLGQAAAEFALLLPLIALLVMGLVDLGRVFYTYEAVTNAAREGARYCAQYPYPMSAGETVPTAQARLTKRVVSSGDPTPTPNTAELGGRIPATVEAWVMPAGTPVSGVAPTPTPAPYCRPADDSKDVTVRVSSDVKPITPLIGNITGDPIHVRSAATQPGAPLPTPTP